MSAEKTWTFIDKAAWPRGQWDDEPDKIEWRDEATGLPCIIRRGPSGALCGYVAVVPGHPWHRKGYGECLAGRGGDCYEHAPEGIADVHGGLTYSGACQEGDDHGICHVPRPGESADAWWFGFDCAHYQDRTPGHEQYGPPLTSDVTYRDVTYVRAQVASLAAQITGSAS